MKSFLSFELSLKSRKSRIGILLGLLFLILLFISRNSYIGDTSKINNSHFVALAFLVLFILVGSIHITARKPAAHYVINVCWSLVFTVTMLLWSFTTLDALAIWRLPVRSFLLNCAFIFALVNILYFVTKKWKFSVNFVGIFLFVVAIINGYVWQFRSREILFSDLSAAGTALMVVKEYTPTITFRMILGLAIWVLVFFSQFSFSSHPEHTPPVKRRWPCFILAMVLLLVMIAGAWSAQTYTYGTLGSTKNGFYVNFIASFRDSIIHAPDGYSQQAVQDVEKDYLHEIEQPADMPNIIVIMNESFADFRVLGDNVHTNQPVTPFYDSLTQNTIRGFAYASVYGGSTANSEFEFLTGLTMGFLPIGSTPYQQHIQRNTFSLAWLLQSYGYDCFATHPYLAKNWSRPVVYPQLGFAESTFIQDYPQTNLLRNWVSDQEMYEYILKKMEHTQEKQPLFIFGVTMQNHGGYMYTGDNYTQTISLEGYSENYPNAEQYLSILNESDKALSYLVSQLEQSDEKTLLVFFGDHFPDVESDLYEEIHGGPFDSLDEQMLQYKIPFLIWANYDIPEQTIPCTSLNYLSRYLLDAADIELPEYYRFLSDMETVIPAMNAMGFYSPTAQKFIPYEDAAGAEAEWLNKYAIIQYNSLFDTESRSNLFFSQYISSE